MSRRAVGAETLFARGCRDVLRHLGDHADQQRLGALDAQELADGDRGFAHRIDALQRQADARLRAADRKDAPAGAPRIENRTGGMCRVHCRLRRFSELQTSGRPRQRSAFPVSVGMCGLD